MTSLSIPSNAKKKTYRNAVYFKITIVSFFIYYILFINFVLPIHQCVLALSPMQILTSLIYPFFIYRISRTFAARLIQKTSSIVFEDKKALLYHLSARVRLTYPFSFSRTSLGGILIENTAEMLGHHRSATRVIRYVLDLTKQR